MSFLIYSVCDAFFSFLFMDIYDMSVTSEAISLSPMGLCYRAQIHDTNIPMYAY